MQEIDLRELIESLPDDPMFYFQKLALTAARLAVWWLVKWIVKKVRAMRADVTEPYVVEIGRQGGIRIHAYPATVSTG